MSRIHKPGEDAFKIIKPENIDWKPFAAFPHPAQLAVLVGDPSRPGPYVVRTKLPHDTRIMPHTHPEDRIYTVISGVLYVGLGAKFNETNLFALQPGTVIVLPGGQPHFYHAKSGEYITQVEAIGPLGLEYLDPTDDPRNNSAWR